MQGASRGPALIMTMLAIIAAITYPNKTGSPVSWREPAPR